MLVSGDRRYSYGAGVYRICLDKIRAWSTRRLQSTAPALLVGVNIGGLGTLIASMASLISYKQLAVAHPELKGYCFLLFTGLNCAFLAALLALAVAIF